MTLFLFHHFLEQKDANRFYIYFLANNLKVLLELILCEFLRFGRGIANKGLKTTHDIYAVCIMPRTCLCLSLLQQNHIILEKFILWLGLIYTKQEIIFFFPRKGLLFFTDLYSKLAVIYFYITFTTIINFFDLFRFFVLSSSRRLVRSLWLLNLYVQLFERWLIDFTTDRWWEAL